MAAEKSDTNLGRCMDGQKAIASKPEGRNKIFYDRTW